MLDIKLVRDNPELLDKALIARGAEPQAQELLALDEKRRQVMTELQELQQRRNEVSSLVGSLKAKGEDASHLFEEMKTIGPKMKELQDVERQAQEDFNDKLVCLPNIQDEDTPEGLDEESNVVVHTFGEPTTFDFEPKPHYELGENLGQMSTEMGAKIAGSRFTWLQGDIAKLERALGQYMLNKQTEQNGYTEVNPPLMCNADSMFAVGQLPKFEEDLFKTGEGYYLLPTAEAPLTNYARNEIFAEKDLPIQLTALTPCFRSEAGSAGRDTRGYLRQHQFMKVEMVWFVKPEDSMDVHEKMRRHAEEILEDLKLPYRTVRLCAGDLSANARRCYDLEVWLPAQNTYREISSCSNFGDFQARRMKARYRDEERNTQFIHTLNGSGLAVGRTLIAVMENYQQADGSIKVPEVLVPLMGKEVIEAK